LKLNHPDQRPHALFTVINEEGQKPFVPGQDDPVVFEKQAKEVFDDFFKNCQKAKKQEDKKLKKQMKKEEKKLKKQMKKDEKKLKKQLKKEEKKIKKQIKKAEKKAKKQEKKQLKKDQKKAKQLACDEENTLNLMAIFQICEEKRDELFAWVSKQKFRNVNRLANKFINKNLFARFCSESNETKVVEETQDTQGEDSLEEVVTPEGDEETETEPEPVVIVKEID